jgi:hypothetical protein
MTQRKVAFALLVLLSAAPGSRASAQTAADLAGSYSFVHEVRDVNGTQSTIDAKGILVFDTQGHYTLTIIAPNVPAVASNNRMTATPEEAKAIVAATTAHFGTYAVEQGNLVFRIERASYPNWNGIQQTRPFSLKGDELRYSVNAASGGGSITLTWKRIR